MTNLLPLILIFGVMWLVILLPQQRRAKNHRAMLAALSVGDQVLLSSGIYGEVTDFDGPTLFVEVADGVEIKVTKESVTERIDSYDGDAADTQDDA